MYMSVAAYIHIHTACTNVLILCIRLFILQNKKNIACLWQRCIWQFKQLPSLPTPTSALVYRTCTFVGCPPVYHVCYILKLTKDKFPFYIFWSIKGVWSCIINHFDVCIISMLNSQIYDLCINPLLGVRSTRFRHPPLPTLLSPL